MTDTSTDRLLVRVGTSAALTALLCLAPASPALAADG